ncbi:MAG: carbohydrate ABC transporter permease [Caldilineaceae bacterium]|nr:carbohydrate ABC transporter permease [Caldilineaceae bacterium]
MIQGLPGSIASRIAHWRARPLGSWEHTWRVFRRRLGTLLRWIILLDFAYIFLFPVIFMITTSIKTVHELNNPAVNWISRTPTNEGYLLAMEVLQYFDGVRVSLGTSIVAAVGQTLIGAMVAYGFARIRFPGRDFLFALLLFTIVVPPQTTMVPQFMLYTDLKWTNTYLPLMVPPFLSYGVRGGILLIVFRQFFRGLPYELEDAAHVDGAGPFRIFWQIMLPLAKPAILVVMLFSLVWTWNDNFTPWLVLRDNTLYTLTQRMEIFNSLLNNFSGSTYTRLEENTFMAAVTLTVLPVLLIYLFAQRYFTQSIDRTGLVE